MCSISSPLSGPNYRKTISFNLHYFPESLTKSLSAHSSPGTMHDPQISTNNAWPTNLHKFLHSSSGLIHTQEALLWELQGLSSPHKWRKKVTDHPGLPKEHFPGPEPSHQQNLMSFDSITCFWLNSPIRPCLPPIKSALVQNIAESTRGLSYKPFSLHGYLGNTRIYLY